MTALTVDAQLKSRKPDVIGYKIADNVKIFKGSLVCRDTAGYANIGADTSGFVCLGIAEEQVDNTTTGHSAGRYWIRVRSGEVFTLAASGMAQSSVGKAAYTTDSGTVGLTATNNVYVGIITRYNSATSVDVFVPTPGIADLITDTAAQLNLVTQGVAAGYKLARGVAAVTGTATVVTGLATVVAVVATPQSDPDGVALAMVSATIGDQAGTPAAGSVILKAWKVTATGNATLIAATAAQNINWVAIGT